MDLQQFVEVTLSQIVQGVADAQKSLNSRGDHVNPALHTHPNVLQGQGRVVAHNGSLIQHVEFDVAVTVTSASATSGSPTIGVVSAGSQEDSSTRTGQNGIKFSVLITLP